MSRSRSRQESTASSQSSSHRRGSSSSTRLPRCGSPWQRTRSRDPSAPVRRTPFSAQPTRTGGHPDLGGVVPDPVHHPALRVGSGDEPRDVGAAVHVVAGPAPRSRVGGVDRGEQPGRTPPTAPGQGSASSAGPSSTHGTTVTRTPSALGDERRRGSGGERYADRSTAPPRPARPSPRPWSPARPTPRPTSDPRQVRVAHRRRRLPARGPRSTAYAASTTCAGARPESVVRPQPGRHAAILARRAGTVPPGVPRLAPDRRYPQPLTSPPSRVSDPEIASSSPSATASTTAPAHRERELHLALGARRARPTLSNKYAEGYPASTRRLRGLSSTRPRPLGIERAKSLGTDHANLQPTAARAPTSPSTARSCSLATPCS